MGFSDGRWPAMQDPTTLEDCFPRHPSASVLPNGAADPRRSYWLHDRPLRDSETRVPDAADVAIIGSGISGISALYHLLSKTQHVLHIVVLEARDVCSGATGRNGGHCTDASALYFATHADRFGHTDAIAACRLEDRCVSHILGLVRENALDVDLTSGGRVVMFRTAQESAAARASLEEASHHGVDVSHMRWFTAEELATEYGASGVHSAIGTVGHNLHPHKLVEGILEVALDIAKAKGCTVSLHTHAPVLAIARDRERWQLRTRRGATSAKLVLHATNGYVSHLLPDLCSHPRVVVPCRGQVIAVRPHPASERWPCAFSADEDFDYLFQRASTSNEKSAPLVILGGGRHKTDPPHELGVADDSTLNATIARYLRAFLPTLFPLRFPRRWLDWLLGGVKVEFEWAGIMGMTRDGDPIVGRVPLAGHDGQYMSCGFNGHGMSRAFSCAEAIADMVLSDMFGKGQPADWPDWLPCHFRSTRDPATADAV